MKVAAILVGTGSILGLWLPNATVAQESANHFDAAVLQLNPSSDPWSYVLDWDGDGDTDVLGDSSTVGSNFTHRYVSVYLNDGSGRMTYDSREVFTEYDSSTFNPRQIYIATGRLDGDSREDYVIGAGKTLRVYFSAPAGASLQLNTSFSNFIHDVVVGDVDNDGSNEFVVLSTNRIRLYEVSSLSQVASIVVPSLGPASFVRLGQMNGASGMEVVLTTPSEITVYAYDGFQFDGGTSFAHATADFLPAVGDVTGNGFEDVVLFGPSDYQILRQTGAGVFSLDDLTAGGPAAELADVDADGDLDGVCCGGGGGPIHDDPAEFQISINEGGGVFAASFKLDGLAARKLAGAQDLDADGDVDLIAGRAVYYGDGFANPPAPDTQVGVPIESSICDAEGEGDLDLAVQLDSVAVNLGNGTFVLQAMSRDPDPAEGAVVGPGFAGDFDGDGDSDLVVEVQNAGAFVQMQLLLNQGGGFFADGGAAAPAGVRFLAEGPLPEMARIIDADSDDDIDIITCTAIGPVGSVVWVNDGTGTFSAGLDLTATGHHVIFAGDLNGDPKTDLLTHGPGGFLWHRGLSAGQFSAALVALPTSSHFQELVNFNALLDRVGVADYNGDGYNDIMAVQRTFGGIDNTLYYLRNHGAVDPGRFTAVPLDTQVFTGYTSHIAYAGSEARRVFSVDVDQDGDPDVVVTPTRDDLGVLALQNTDPDPLQWNGPTLQLIDLSAVADLDGDGAEDAVGQKFYRNRSFAPEVAGVREQYGVGSAGLGNIVPALGASGPFRAGEAAALHLVGVAGQAFTLLAVSLAPAATPNFPAPGLTSYLGPWTWFSLFPTGGTLNEPGAGSFTLPYVVPAEVQNVPVYHQVIHTHPLQSLTHSNGLLLYYQ